MIVKKNAGRAVWLAACASAAFAMPAFAQQAAPAPAPAPEAREYEEVIVTATRRDTALQNVAVAVTAIGEAALQDAGVKDIRDLTQIAPSLQVPVSENSGSVTARVRGVGTQGSNPGLESSVGVFVDGVYRARNGVAFGDLGEIRSVEVLRGPQGTLFGRNTSAGLINVVTKKPAFEFGTSGDITFGNYGAAGFGAGVTGPLVEDEVAGRLFVSARKRDGYFQLNEGQANAAESHDQDYWTVRGQLLFTPNERFDARLIADYATRSEACCGAEVWLTDTRTPSTTAIINRLKPNSLAVGRDFSGDYNGHADTSYAQDIEDQGLSFEANLDVGLGKLTSVTAWRNWSRTASTDSDYTNANILYSLKDNGTNSEFTTFTQEFRLAGNAGKLDWLVGAFFSDETIDAVGKLKIGTDYQAYIGSLLGPALALVNPALAVNPLNPAVTNAQLAGVVSTWQTILGVLPANIGTLAGGGGQQDVYKQDANSWSLFTHNIFEVTDDLSITLGLRYTNEEKKFQGQYSTSGNTACRALEARLGLNPVANAGALGGVVGAICAPWMRSALDGMNHRQAKTEKEWSGIASASYRIVDNINTYLSYSRGYKAGGFNLDRAFSDLAGGVPTSIVSGAPGAQTVRQPDTSFAPETVDAYELGIKTQWFDRQLTANLAFYHQTFENFQLNTFTGISFVVTAVPEVVAKGIELDFILRPDAIDGLTITGGAALTDAQYADNLGSAADPRTFLGQNPNLYFLPGTRLTSAPTLTYGSAINYERPIMADAFTLNAYVDFRYTGDNYTGSNVDPRKIQKAYTLVNARLGISGNEDRWTVELWGRNLTDERYAQITFDSALQGDGPQLNRIGTTNNFAPRPINSQLNAFMGEPRMYGVTLRWNY
jgi:outer membrane receptor protein involved in Fe transport